MLSLSNSVSGEQGSPGDHYTAAAAAVAGNAMEHQLLGLSVCMLCLGFKKYIYECNPGLV